MYYWAGRAIATILVHGGPSIAIFTGAVYQCIAYGCDEAEPDIKDVPCAVVRRFLTDLKSCKSQGEVGTVINHVNPVTLEDCSSIMLDAGVTTNPALEDIPAVLRRLTKFHTVGKYRSELEDFMKGLKHHGILDLVRKQPTSYEKIFVPGHQIPITGKYLMEMFVPIFSEVGANKRQKEEIVMEYWITYLDDMDKDLTVTKPTDVLRFASAVEEVPVLGWGFERTPTLVFDHEAAHKFPSSSTCGPTVVLPIYDYSSQNHFVECIEESIISSPCILGN